MILADGSVLVLVRDQRISLRDDAQLGLQALNVVGATGSDVGNAANVLTQTGSAAGRSQQRNWLSQRELQAGALGRASLAADSTLRRTAVERSLSDGRSSTLLGGRESHTWLRTTSVDQFAAFVPAYNPLHDLTLTVGTPSLAPLHIPGIGFDFIDRTDVGDYGVAGSIGPFTIGAPQLVLGTVRLDGDDVVLSSGYVQVPGLDLGVARLEGCFIDCASFDADLGGFDGLRVDIPGGDLRFEGANPFKDISINAGHGVALAGAGRLDVTPGRVTVGAELTLDLPDPDFSFDITIPGFAGIGPWQVSTGSIGIEIPPVSFSHTLIDEDVGVSYSASFDGVLCLVFMATECGQSSRQTSREELRVDVVLDTATHASHSTGSLSRDESLLSRAGATLTAAEAELIAMSHSSARIDSSSAVVLQDAAQSGLQAVNAVNAVGAIVGSGLNVSTVAPAAAAPGVAAGFLGQSNTFIQNRTRYGL